MVQVARLIDPDMLVEIEATRSSATANKNPAAEAAGETARRRDAFKTFF